MRFRIVSIVAIVFLLCSAFYYFEKSNPVLYIIGDSTVKNGSGNGSNGQWGWGSFIASYFDTMSIDVQNHAIGGRSSRTFLTEGRWDKILSTLKKGDFVMIQFGHNDASPLDDTARARGTIKGIGNDSVVIFNPIRKIQETVFSYGHYMRLYVKQAKEKGATVIVCSLVPRDNWKNGKVTRSADSYAGWAQAVAKEEGAYFIDLNEKIAARYEALGQEIVHSYFPADHTHTNKEGAILNASIVIEELRSLSLKSLTKHLKK